ncbi:MAG: flippase-like domain-containing protein [Acidobacteria bacterium]|nr:flippase-like domain-containing protein [Acidobacteriota bacterium]
MNAAEARVVGWPTHRTLFLLVVNLISLGCLVWVLHDLDVQSLSREVAAMHWGWVSLAVVADISVYLLQGWRWSLLLAPLGAAPFWRSVRAIYVGLFANEILPLRTGEIIRCYLLGRWSKLPFSVVLSSALIERVFDGAWLTICLVVTLQFVRLPAILVNGFMTVAIFVLAGAVVIGFGMYWKEQSPLASSNNRVLRKLHVLIEDLHIIGHSKNLYWAALASLPYLIIQVLPVYALARAYGSGALDLTLWQAAVLTIILRLSSAIPQAPGNLGIFNAFTVIGLKLFGVNERLARRFSIVMWSVITLPLLIAGFIALAVTGVRMNELRRQAHASMAPIPRAQPEN